MSVTRIAHRYAKSLLDLSIEENSVDVVKNDMDFVIQTLKSRDFYLMLKSPIIFASDKLAVINKVLALGNVHKLTAGFLDLLVKKGRENFLPEITRAFMDEYRVYKKITAVKVKSAAPLTDEELRKIKEKIIASGHATTNIEFDVTVDPSLIGGFILEFNNEQMDASVASKFRVLRQSMN